MDQDHTVPPRTWLDRSAEFETLPRLVKELLFRCMRPREFPAGSRIIRQGDPGRDLMLVTRGRAVASLADPSGERRVLSRFAPGEIFGEMALVTKEPRSADVDAETDVRVLSLAADDFDALATEFPSVAVVLTNLVAERLGRRWVDGMSGKVVDHYRVCRCVGRGGMAVVYEAEDVDRNERVALKMMSHQLVYTPGAMERFEREASILLALRHRHVSRVFKHFPAYRTSFIAMEFCDGASLARLLREGGPMPEEVARGVLGQLAAALQYLHEQDVVHRDLKPGNIMFDRRGELKLTDFGLARPGAVTGLPRLGDDMSAVLVGTPTYMAPELFSGEGQGRTADLYALGCVALELLTGAPPVRTRDLGALIAAKQAYDLPKYRRFPARVSRGTHRMLRRLLDRDPARRAVELGELASWAAPLPVRYLELDPETSF